MAVQIRDLSEDWRPGDAERLARLMNDASAGWPHGTSDPQTPEQAARQVRERRMLGTFVAVEGDRFISQQDFWLHLTLLFHRFPGAVPAEGGFGESSAVEEVEYPPPGGVSRRPRPAARTPGREKRPCLKS